MARRLAFAVLVILIWPGLLYAQESVQGAESLYASAAYDEALAMLDRLQKQPLQPSDERDVQQNRALCLLALGRNDEAALAVAAVVTSDPAYRPSESGTSPRVRAMFRDVRGRLLPGLIAARYNEGRAAYDNQQWADAGKAFQLVMALAADHDLLPSDAKAVQDYKVLAEGFAKLVAGATSATGATGAAGAEPVTAIPNGLTAVVPEPPILPASAAAASVAPVTPVAPAARIYNASDTGVVPPTVIRQDIPRWTVIERPSGRDGVLELTIGVDGRIERATITQSMSPVYDHSLLEATRNWRYEPAMLEGHPVRYRKAIRITFQ